MNKYYLLTWGALLLLTITGCASRGSGQQLSGQVWIGTTIYGEKVLSDTTITAEFKEDGTLSGSSGCNRYNTAYTAGGDKLQINHPITRTLMACPDPVMTQEQAYVAALGAVAGFEILDDALTLFDDSGGPLVTFVAGSNELTGTNWEVISYNNGKEAVVSVIIGTQITANFGEDGQLIGSGGCNRYFAPYETDGDRIQIGPAGSTEMACMEPEGVMEQEQQYLAALGMAEIYRIEADRMEMRTSAGSLAVNFRRLP